MSVEGSTRAKEEDFILIGYDAHATFEAEITAMLSGKGQEGLLERQAIRNRFEKKLERFLEWIKNNFNPQLVLYPFSGWHIAPREIFGDDHVIHLSDDQCHSYLLDIGHGQRIRGDGRQPPLLAGRFDAVLLNGETLKTEERQTFFSDLRSLIRPGGLVIDNALGMGPIHQLCIQHLKPLSIPADLIYTNGPLQANYLFENTNIQQ